MSLGNNTDDSDLARCAVLYEAAIQVVVHHRPESKAVSFSEDLIAEREQAEANGSAQVDFDGNVSGYANDELNGKPVSAEQRTQIQELYSALCEREDLKPES
jgi:hypothetical protein